MTEQRQIPEFGRRRPAPVQPVAAAPTKRSGHVALLLMGTLAVGGGAYALMPSENCQPASPGMAAPAMPQASGCTPRTGGGGSGGYSRSTHFSFFGGDSSGRSSSMAPADTNSGRVTRGGFGGFAHAFGFSGHS